MRTLYTRRYHATLSIDEAAAFVGKNPGYVGYIVQVSKTGKIRIVFSYGHVMTSLASGNRLALSAEVAHINETTKGRSYAEGAVVGVIEHDPSADVPASIVNYSEALSAEVASTKARDTYFCC